MGKTFVVGDTHIPSDIDKLNSSNWPEQKSLTKDDVLIQLGDFGAVWYEKGTNQEQEYWMNWLATRKYTMLVVPGNHENYDVIEDLPECEMFGGKVQYYESEERDGKKGIVYFAIRGEIYIINGKTFWAFGGALSIDKDMLILGKDYWEQETSNWYEFNRGMDSLDKVNWKVDYVVTHTCPVNVIGSIIHRTVYTEGKFKDPIAEYFKEIENKLEFKEWHFGHFHTDVRVDYSDSNDGIFHCHYNFKPYELV
jgi:hypothetical protein